MEILEYDEVINEILKHYNKNPKGWQVLMGRSPKGFYDFIFSNPEKVWLVKLDTIYKPNPIGFGTVLTDTDPSKIKINDLPSYGFRPVSEKVIDLIMNGDISSALKMIMEVSPTPTEKISDQLVAVGPYIHKPTHN